MKCLLLILVASVVASDEDWLHCSALDAGGKYHVCWLIDDGQTEITFRVDVQTHGYVGFGLSSNGAMKGSDIVTGWIQNADVYFQDRHGVGNALPEMDSVTNWNLVSGSENDTHTSLIFKRQLNTMDEEDMEINDITTWLIYAYSDTDPTSENDLSYHYQNRGAKNIDLLQPKRTVSEIVDKSEWMHWDILSNFSLTSEDETIYFCTIHKGPVLTTKHHVVSVETLFKEENKNYVHHILLFECPGVNPEEYDALSESPGQECYGSVTPDMVYTCEALIYAWGIGSENLVFPDNVGLPLEPDIPKYYMLEMHFSNLLRHNVSFNSTGLRLYYTQNLRENDAGSLVIGGKVNADVFIPPNRNSYVVAAHSDSVCFDPVMPKEGLKIIGVGLHSHLLGRQLKARHFRNKTELQPLAEDPHFDFNYQRFRIFSKERGFLPGDQITVECDYDSSGRNETTLGGHSIKEEMCQVFLLYYPRIERFISFSGNKIKEVNKLLGSNLKEEDMVTDQYRNFLRNYNWDTVDVKKVENTLRYAEQESSCWIGKGKYLRSNVSYPENFTPYKRHGRFDNQVINGCSRAQQWFPFIVLLTFLLNAL